LTAFVSNELIRPEDSASQLLQNSSTTTESSLEQKLSIGSQSDISLSGPLPNPRIKLRNQWLWTQFSINLLPGKLWQLKRIKKQVEN
jgi:hypothetical protein